MVAESAFDPIEEAARQWRSHWGEGAVSSMAAVTSIMRAQQILMGRLNTLLKPLGLTFPRYEALMILYLSKRGSLPLGKIGERLQVHPTSVTNLIDGLERSGYVSREPHESDRRATLASLTTEGRRVGAAATELLNNSQFGLDILERRELDDLVAVLRRLRAQSDHF